MAVKSMRRIILNLVFVASIGFLGCLGVGYMKDFVYDVFGQWEVVWPFDSDTLTSILMYLLLGTLEVVVLAVMTIWRPAGDALSRTYVQRLLHFLIAIGTFVGLLLLSAVTYALLLARIPTPEGRVTAADLPVPFVMFCLLFLTFVVWFLLRRGVILLKLTETGENETKPLSGKQRTVLLRTLGASALAGYLLTAFFVTSTVQKVKAVGQFVALDQFELSRDEYGWRIRGAITNQSGRRCPRVRVTFDLFDETGKHVTQAVALTHTPLDAYSLGFFSKDGMQTNAVKAEFVSIVGTKGFYATR